MLQSYTSCNLSFPLNYLTYLRTHTISNTHENLAEIVCSQYIYIQSSLFFHAKKKVPNVIQPCCDFGYSSSILLTTYVGFYFRCCAPPNIPKLLIFNAFTFGKKPKHLQFYWVYMASQLCSQLSVEYLMEFQDLVQSHLNMCLYGVYFTTVI